MDGGPITAAYDDGALWVRSCPTCAATLYTQHHNQPREFLVPLSSFTQPAHGDGGKIDCSSAFVPVFHMHYAQGSTSFFDGLPKFAQGRDQGGLLSDGHHGRSKPSERRRNCAVEASGHFGSLLAACKAGGASNNPHNGWENEPFTVACPCGHVSFQVWGSPMWTANCHCSVCRRLHGGAPYVSLCGYPMKIFDSLGLSDGGFHQRTIKYNATALEDRYACRKCKGWVLIRLNHLCCTAVFRSNIRFGSDSNINSDNGNDNVDNGRDRFKASCHIFYNSGIHNVYDDLPKYSGFPPLLGGHDRVMLRNDIHGGKLVIMAWREATGTATLALLSLIFLFATPLWGQFLNVEWAHMPWRAWGMALSKQYACLPTFLICEYTMHTLALVALVHARCNAALDLWFAAWVCGTANDVFFMYLPFCDNFWQAQATVMLTPRLPLYIVSMYIVMIYYSNTAARRFGFASPMAESMMTGVLMSVLYGVYDLNGPRYLWWTWHDSDAAIYERLGGAPVGSTMWILTYGSLCNLLLRWCARAGTNECRAFYDGVVEVVERRCLSYSSSSSAASSSSSAAALAAFFMSKALSAGRFLGLREAAVAMDNWQKLMRSGSTVQVIMFVCIACTPLFMVMLGQFSVFSLDIAGKPGTRTLALTLVVFIAVIMRTNKRQPPAGEAGRGDNVLAVLVGCYFGSHVWMMVAFDPTTHVSTGVHQIWSPICGNSTAYDIMGFERQDHLCGSRGPRDASAQDYMWGETCGAGWADTVVPSGDELVEWYTVCGVARRPELARMVLLASLGVVLYGSAFFSLLPPLSAFERKKRSQ